jgi:hypothetical protein
MRKLTGKIKGEMNNWTLQKMMAIKLADVS